MLSIYYSESEKPLVRWTIGPVSDIGHEILCESVRRFSEVYPEFDRVVCYNHIERPKLPVSCDYFDQSTYPHPCQLSEPDSNIEQATGCGWKLVPPRLRPKGLELFIDNDLIIRNRIKELDEWIKDKTSGLISEGLHRKRMFGMFDGFISPEIRACAGLFGMPPYFDFMEKIKHYTSYSDKPLGGYDEQGLTVATVTNMSRYILVPLSSLHICEDHVPFPDSLPDALHFVGANRKPWHRGWKAYKKASRQILMI